VLLDVRFEQRLRVASTPRCIPGRQRNNLVNTSYPVQVRAGNVYDNPPKAARQYPASHAQPAETTEGGCEASHICSVICLFASIAFGKDKV